MSINDLIRIVAPPFILLNEFLANIIYFHNNAHKVKARMHINIPSAVTHLAFPNATNGRIE